MVTDRIPPEHHDFNRCRQHAVPMIEILDRISGKWSLYIIMSLLTGPMRFSELQRQVEGISQKMLTQTLRELEEDGIVHRTVTPIIPPRVDYELTDMGHELKGPIDAISQWTNRNNEKIAQARERYAAAKAA